MADSTPLFYCKIQDSWWWFLCQQFLQMSRNLGLISVALSALPISVWKLFWSFWDSRFFRQVQGEEVKQWGGEGTTCAVERLPWVGTLNNAPCWSWTKSPIEVTDSTALYNSGLDPSLLSWPKNGVPEETTQRCWNWSPGHESLNWGKLCLLGLLWE